VKLVFIGGYMHSGTTLLRDVLCNLPGAVAAKGESHFLEFLPRLRALHPDVDTEAGEDRFRLLCRQLLDQGFDFSVLKGPPSSREPAPEALYLRVYREEIEQFARERGGSLFVSDAGTQVFSHRQIAMLSPDAYLVTVTRDVRDVLASKKTRRDTVFTGRYEPAQQARKHLEKGYDPVWDSISWRTFARASLASEASLGDRAIRLRYEDLTTDPVTTVRGIAAALGVDEPGELHIRANNAADPSVQRAGIDASSIGRWRTTLPASHVATAEWLCGDELTALGYDHGAARLTLAVGGQLVRSAGEPVTRLYRRARLGGIDGAAAMLRNYLRRLRPESGR
jgi:hypothetical protein